MRWLRALLKNASLAGAPKYIEHFSKFSPSPLSMKQFLDFGTKWQGVGGKLDDMKDWGVSARADEKDGKGLLGGVQSRKGLTGSRGLAWGETVYQIARWEWRAEKEGLGCLPRVGGVPWISQTGTEMQERAASIQAPKGYLGHPQEWAQRGKEGCWGAPVRV